MKKLFVVLFMLISIVQVKAEIKFIFTPGSIDTGALKTRMENNISTLLTEIHSAGTTGRNLNLTSVNMENAAKEHLTALWEVLPFVCEEEVNVSKCLNDHQGYQVRGVQILMKPKDNTYDQSVYRELTISLSRDGIITGIRPALEIQEDVTKIMGEGRDVEDLTRRREILKWVEDFRNYYNERNLNSLKQIYSDDALIITGSVVMQRSLGDFGNQLSTNVKYTVQSKVEYIAKLERIFKLNRYINVKFDHISVVRHGAKPNIYGVTLHQAWRTSNYSDDGWLFLLWDFTDPDRPQIHVRTWQPEQVVAQNGVFTLDDFFIP